MKFKLPFISAKDKRPDGIYLISSRANGMALQLLQGPVDCLQVVPNNASLRVSTELDGSRSKLTVKFEDGQEWEQKFFTEERCKSAQSDLIRAISRSRFTFKQAALSVLVGLATIFFLSPSPQAVASLPPAAVSVAPVQAAPPAGSKLAGDEMQKLLAAHTTTGVALNPGGSTFTVFSDPNCPYCRDLERSLAQMDNSLSPVMLPLGFKDGSRDLSAAILCAKDPAASWMAYMRDGKQPTTAACNAGYAKVDANMNLFRELQLGSTPTLVSPSGTVIVGSGTPDAIRMVMAN